MKTKAELLELISEAILSNGKWHNQWFINFSGHFNSISVEYYELGWENSREYGESPKKLDIGLDEEDSIQEGYWFIKNRLRQARFAASYWI